MPGGLTTALTVIVSAWLTATCFAAPGLSITQPADGSSFTAGGNIPLSAVVTNDSAIITSVDFLANGAPLGPGRPSPLGEWEFPDTSHLSIMSGPWGDMMDYHAATTEFFMMGGSFATPNTFIGEFSIWVGGNPDPATGPFTATLSFTADGKLNAVLDGAAPLNTRTLYNGARWGDEAPYTFNWTGVPAGSYALEAVVHYGASQTVTSAPVNIIVVGGKRNGSDRVVNLTATPAHDHNWYDEQNQFVVNQGIVHTAWHSRWLDPDGILAATNRIYYTASTQSGISPENWILLDERTDSPYQMDGGVWMAVDFGNIHIVTVSQAWADDGGGLHGYVMRYHRSTDGGMTFEPARVLATAAYHVDYMDAPLIAASQGRVTIAWRGSTGETGYTVHVMNSADNGNTFTAQTLFNDESGLLNLSELRQESQAIALAWKHHASSGGATHIACSTNGGTNYTVTEIEPYIVEYAAGSTAGADLPQVALQGSTVLIAYFSENTNANPIVPDVFVRHSTNGGATFGPAQSLTQGALSSAAGLPTGGQLDLSLSGNRAAAVFATSGAHVYLARSTNAGASFLPPQQLSDSPLNYGTAGNLDPRLAFQPYDPHAVHVMWASDWYRRSTNGGETWSAPVRLSLVPSGWIFQPTPRMVADESGAVHWNCSGYWNMSDYDDTDVLYRSFKHAAGPPATMNLGAQFGQEHDGFLRYDNLQIPACPALDFTNALTVECWVKLSETNAPYPVLVAKPISGAGISYNAFHLHVSGESPTKRWFAANVSTDGGASDATYPTNANNVLTIRPGVWYHVAFTFDGGAGAGNLKLYVNGVLQGAVNAPGTLSTSPEPIQVSRYLDGAMDDLRFWNRALTVEEIRDRFTGPLVGNEPGLAAYYTFDGTWADATSNGLPAVPMYRESFGEGADVQPILGIESLPGNQVRLNWLTFGASYQLQTTTTLGAPDWQPVAGMPSLINGRWSQTLTMTGETHFFRLVRQ